MYLAKSMSLLSFLFFFMLAFYPLDTYAVPKVDPNSSNSKPTSIGKISDSSLTANRGRYWRNYYRPHYYTYYPRSYYYNAYPPYYSGVRYDSSPYYKTYNPYYYNTYNSSYYYYPAGASFTVGW